MFWPLVPIFKIWGILTLIFKQFHTSGTFEWDEIIKTVHINKTDYVPSRLWVQIQHLNLINFDIVKVLK